MKKRLSLFTLIAMLILTFAMPMTVFAAQVEVPPASESTTDTSNASEGDSTTSSSDDDDEGTAEYGIRLGTGDAVNDILNDNRFEGAIESISFITKFVDHWFTVLITATAFFIISAAMLRNVMAGAYCSNHKFWDKVAEAHEKADAVSIASIGQFISGKQFMNTTGGGFRDALLCIVPNIKAWTDFDDVDIEPKQYFMKAIPQMLACIIIGVFIYNGYYRDTAATVGDFGSEICNRVFASIDPGKVVDKITLTTRTPDNIYKTDPTVEGQYRYTISMAAYKVIVSSFSDYTATDEKTALMRNCEKLAYDVTTNTDFHKKFIESVSNSGKEFTLSNCKVRLTPSVDCPVSLGSDSSSITWVDSTFPEDSSETSFVAGYALCSSFNLTPIGMSPSTNDTFYITMSMKKVSSKSKSNAIASSITSDGSKNSSSVPDLSTECTVALSSDATIANFLHNAENQVILINAVKAKIAEAGYSLGPNMDDAHLASKISNNAKFAKGSDYSTNNVVVQGIEILKPDPDNASKQIKAKVMISVRVKRTLK